jgi:hydrogenase-1 operon protein HyaF
MPSVSDIPILPDLSAAAAGMTGNLMPILSEIRQALADYIASGTTKTIDLLAMPFAPGDEAALIQALGGGEVSAELQVLGPSRIWETRFAGVWLVDHGNEAGERLALQVEITDVPDLLRAQPEDMRSALGALDRHLESLSNTEEQP